MGNKRFLGYVRYGLIGWLGGNGGMLVYEVKY